MTLDTDTCLKNGLIESNRMCQCRALNMPARATKFINEYFENDKVVDTSKTLGGSIAILKYFMQFVRCILYMYMNTT
jgi:hypothetical protein